MKNSLRLAVVAGAAAAVGFLAAPAEASPRTSAFVAAKVGSAHAAAMSPACKNDGKRKADCVRPSDLKPTTTKNTSNIVNQNPRHINDNKTWNQNRDKNITNTIGPTYSPTRSVNYNNNTNYNRNYITNYNTTYETNTGLLHRLPVVGGLL